MSEAMERARNSLYHWILGKEYWGAAKAFDLARQAHQGQRKGGDPEFSHQVWICNKIRTLPIPAHMMERTLIIGLLHDTIEDYAHLRLHILDFLGDEALNDSMRMSKIIDGQKMDNASYMDKVLSNPATAIVKGVDRDHNLKTMFGCVPIDKQRAQIEETEAYHLPMLKEARKRYPELHLVFEAIKLDIVDQIQVLRALHTVMTGQV